MKRLFIVFPDEWIAYSPTVLNLIQVLSKDFDVRIIAFDNALYDNSSLDSNNFCFIRFPTQISRALYLIRLYAPLKAALLLYKLKSVQADEVIAVDSLALWCVTKCWGKCHFLSLEVKRDFFFKHADKNRISSVIVQSQERYHYLFGETVVPTYYIQNSPPFKRKPLQPAADERFQAICFGNLIPRHGVYLCLEAMAQCRLGCLTLRGRLPKQVKDMVLVRYHSLLQNGRLILDDTYLETDEVITYLSRFQIGFCFYDFNRIKDSDFNYISAPSGKVFYYYAAGVPVIGSDILGLKSIRDFNAGIVLRDVSPESIVNAMQIILAQHSRFRENCLKAAQHYDFNRAVTPFRNRLLGEPET